MLLYLLTLFKDNYLELRLCHGFIVDLSHYQIQQSDLSD